MGCDIHLFPEKLVDGKWVYLHEDLCYVGNADGRDYRLFALLANVRNPGYVLPLAMPRGLPDDLSDTTQLVMDKRAEDYHSHSFFHAEELEAAADNGAFNIVPKQWSSFASFVDELCRNTADGTKRDVRLVFCFDN